MGIFYSFSRSLIAKWSFLLLARVNSVMFYLLWTCAPILVSIISFFVYVMQGKELTVSIAFTVSRLLFLVVVNSLC